ncbi:MAG: TrkA family potassium uptake protein [Haloferacaceae archaeon]
MRFVIVGAGRVGLRTARVLREEGHHVVVVDDDPDRVDRAAADGFETVEGDGAREETLERAGVDSADAVGALTGDINANFAACMIGKHHGCRTVLRIDEDYREDMYRKYADEVDDIVYPERLGAIGAKNALLGGNIQAIADVAQDLQLLLVTVREESPVRGYSIEEVTLPARARLLAFGKRGGSMGIPFPDDSVEAGDRLAVLAEFEVLEEVRQLLVGADVEGGD